MSLPMARARRKKVPSIQRSPNSQHAVPLARPSRSKPRVVMSQASWSSPTSQSSLTRRISESDAGEVVVAALVGRDQRGRRAGRRRGARGSWPTARGASSSSSMWRHLEAEGVGDLLQRRAAADPQLAVLPVAEELVGVARGARAGVEHRLAVLDDQHGVAGLVAGEVGVGGVGAEAVVGVVGAHLEAAGRQHQPLAGERLGQPLRGARRPSRRDRVRAAGRARGRPSPSRMKAA